MPLKLYNPTTITFKLPDPQKIQAGRLTNSAIVSMTNCKLADFKLYSNRLGSKTRVENSGGEWRVVGENGG